VTEEVWSWWHEGSVHRAAWPGAPLVTTSSDEVAVYTTAVEVLGAIRRVKSEAKVSPRTPVERVTFSGLGTAVSAIRQVEADLRAAQNVAQFVVATAVDGEPSSVDVKLA